MLVAQKLLQLSEHCCLAFC